MNNKTRAQINKIINQIRYMQEDAVQLCALDEDKRVHVEDLIDTLIDNLEEAME